MIEGPDKKTTSRLWLVGGKEGPADPEKPTPPKPEEPVEGEKGEEKESEARQMVEALRRNRRPGSTPEKEPRKRSEDAESW